MKTKFGIFIVLLLIIQNCFGLKREHIVGIQESYDTDPSIKLNIPDLHQFYAATVMIGIKDKTSFWRRDPGEDGCTALLVKPNSIYTAYHCIDISSTADFKNRIVTVYDPQTNNLLGQFTMKDVIATPHYSNAYLLGELESLGSQYETSQFDFIDIMIPEKNGLNKIIANKGISPLTKITSATTFTKLVSCDPSLFAKKWKVNYSFEEKCRTLGTKTIAFGHEDNGGWYTVSQESSLLKEIIPNKFSPYGIQLSFGVASSFTYYSEMSRGNKVISTSPQYKFQNVAIGVFKEENISDRYTYTYKKESNSIATLRNLSFSRVPLNIDGDSGGAIVSCDQSNTLGEKGKCYLVGINNGCINSSIDLYYSFTKHL